jgi:type II secretory pathway component PulM
MRTDGWVYRVILALSGITLVLVVVYLVLVQQNRSVQAEINQRQQFIGQSVEFSRVNNALVQAIARAAVSDKDDKLRNLLTQNGIAIDPTTGAPSEKIIPPVSAAPAQPGK